MSAALLVAGAAIVLVLVLAVLQYVISSRNQGGAAGGGGLGGVGGGGAGGGGLAGAAGRRRKRERVLLAGPCGGGKTVMLHALMREEGEEQEEAEGGGEGKGEGAGGGAVWPVQTVTSGREAIMRFFEKERPAEPHEEDEGQEKGKSDEAQDSRPPATRERTGRSVELVDVPGYGRLRGLLLTRIIEAKAIIVVADSSGSLAHMRELAEIVYDIFTSPDMNEDMRMLVVCNKTDLPRAKVKAPRRIRQLLQQELEKIRVTQNTLESTGDSADGGGTNEVTGITLLGRVGEKFNLDVDSPCRVEWAAASASTGKLDEVEQFISDVLDG